MDGFGARSSGTMKRQGRMQLVSLLKKGSVVIVQLEDQVVFQARGMPRVREHMIQMDLKDHRIPFGAVASTSHRKSH